MKANLETSGLRTWIEIDREAIAHNYKSLRGILAPKTMFMAVVKSNAYGHSLVDFSKEIEKLGADWVGVDSIIEGVALRTAGIVAPILVLGYTLPSRIRDAAEQKISIAVSTFETLEEIEKIVDLELSNNNSSFILNIHIKVDTGMHRQGFMTEQIPAVISKLKSLPSNVVVEGLFTHFASAKNPSFPAKTISQIELFNVWQKTFTDAGFDPIVHAAASAGAIVYPQSHFDMVRLGAVTYGVWPSAQVEAFASGKISLKPVMTWKTILSEVKNVPKGESVGYDFTETLERDSKLAICPVGYWHGLPRAVSSIGHVVVNGKKARFVGRVSMDMITIDVTDISNPKVGDVVTIIGQDGSETVSPKYVAELAETSDYEIVTRINPLIKRVVV